MRKQLIPNQLIKYDSKTKRGECKNEKCTNLRQNGSSRCLECSIKFKTKKSPKKALKNKV